ncbi:LpxL/LpxP family acyltransferase [Marinobacterium arenosum]|uniref:LpxL/LpxP family acyltransferase n=1 Tax=Marinobacterium arenosum TaxID=2862496 RepID=UPI001C93B871|nr:lipid A biosynthesis acyltransferase [Marinobacterium arenosum]MBY4676114.1 lipid A biosynthesis acyltransferase [Marinobacterium arenosum]
MAKSDSHWSRTGEAGTVLGMKILLLVYRLLGRTGFRVILIPVMTYYYLTQKEARQASAEYLQRVQVLLEPKRRMGHTPFKHFMMFGEVLLDKFLVWMGHIRREDVVFETPAVFEKIDNNREGGVIVVSHLGNTEVCSALAHQLPGIRLTVLVYTQHAEKFNSLMKKVNSSARIEMMQVTDMSPATAMILSERVEAGEFVVIAGDRTPVTGQQRVSMIDFMGRQAPMPQGAFILAGLLKCPVYLMFCLKQQVQYHIYLELFSERLKFSRKQRQQEIDEAVQRYAGRLEYYCKKAPLQWFNFFPFWSGTSDGKESEVSTNVNKRSVS